MISLRATFFIISLILLFNRLSADGIPDDEFEYYHISCKLFMYAAGYTEQQDLITTDTDEYHNMIEILSKILVYESTKPRRLSTNIIDTFRIKEDSFIRLSLSADLLIKTADILSNHHEMMPEKYREWIFLIHITPDKQKLRKYLEFFIKDLEQVTSQSVSQSSPELTLSFSLDPLCMVALWRLSTYDVSSALPEYTTFLENLFKEQPHLAQLSSLQAAKYSDISFNQHNELELSEIKNHSASSQQTYDKAKSFLICCQTSLEKYHVLLEHQKIPLWSTYILPENYIEIVTQNVLQENQIQEIINLLQRILQMYQDSGVSLNQPTPTSQRFTQKKSFKEQKSKIPIAQSRQRHCLKRPLTKKETNSPDIDDLCRQVDKLDAGQTLKKKARISTETQTYTQQPSRLPRPAKASRYRRIQYLKKTALPSKPPPHSILSSPKLSAVSASQLRQEPATQKTWLLKPKYRERVKHPEDLNHPDTIKPAFGSSAGIKPLTIDSNLPSAELSRLMSSNLRRSVRVEQTKNINPTQQRRKILHPVRRREKTNH